MHLGATSLAKHSSTLHHPYPSSKSTISSDMSSLPSNPFPPPPPLLPVLPAHNPDEHGDTSIINSSLEPQPLPTPSTRWYFDKEQLINTPSRRAGIDGDKELTYRQQSANFIQDMGQRLQVNQLCINTAIVYMHRFYMYHSFQHFQKNAISTASIFLAAKVEEQPRKLEYVIKIAHYCLYRDTMPAIDVKSDNYLAQSRELVSNENILLQTLGFDVSVDHPHTHVVKCCQLVRASKDLAQTSYFMATNSLHLTTMCLQYPPSVVACVCIHLACKWSNWEIPRSKEGKEWYYYVDGSVTPQQLESLTSEFLTIFNKSPSRLKKRILNLSNATSGGSGGSGGGAIANFPTHFTVDRNSSGAQTIKSRSRSPSPTSALQSKSLARPPSLSAKQSIPQPLIGKPIKPVPSGVPPHHFGSKPNPVLPGYPAQGKHPPLNKPQFPHTPMSTQPLPPPAQGATHSMFKEGLTKHPSKSGQSYSTSGHSSSNGTIHQGASGNRPHPSSSSNHHPSSHPNPNHSRVYGQVAPQQQQHVHGISQIQPIGSHAQSMHHNPLPLPQAQSIPQQPPLPPPVSSNRHSLLKPHLPQPTAPLPMSNSQSTPSLPPMSLSTTFPLLSSEIGLTGGTGTSGSGPGPLPSLYAFGGNSQPQSLLIKQEKLSSPPSDSSSQYPPASASAAIVEPHSSSSKKRKKKDHKHKKDKEDKEHRHKDKAKIKEEKKHKKDKHRDKDKDSPDKHRSSKRMKHSKSSDPGLSHVQDNSLKIKIVTSKEALDSKSSRSSGKTVQPTQVEYY